MSHPMHAHRAHKVEKSRVGHITRGYKSGGAVKGDKSIGKQALTLHKHEHEALDAEGHKSKHRMDRPKRADGGRVQTGRQMDEDARKTREILEQRGMVTPSRAKGGKVKGRNNSKTVVNVITGHPGGGAAPPPMAPPGIGGAAMPPPAPPMMAKPPMPGPGMPPPGMPPMRAKGGAVKSIGMHAGTKVQHTDGKDDTKDIGRGRVVTFWAGGKVKKDCGGPIQTPTRARGGRIESPKGVAKATELPGGSGGGEARLVKEARAKRDYHKA
jgi:hypothetical protein